MTDLAALRTRLLYAANDPIGLEHDDPENAGLPTELIGVSRDDLATILDLIEAAHGSTP